MTRLTTVTLVALACYGCDGKVAQHKPEAHNVPVRTAAASGSSMNIYGAAFVVPGTCSVHCTSCILPLQGEIHCTEADGKLDVSGTFVVTEVVRLGRAGAVEAEAYSARSSTGRGECAMVEAEGTSRRPRLRWEFCSHSADQRVRKALREIAESFQPDFEAKRPSACTIEAF